MINSISVNFIFVTPDGSVCRSRSALQGRTAYIYPFRAGCNGERLPEASDEEERDTKGNNDVRAGILFLSSR